MRKYPLVNNCIYHIVTRSIAKYKVFNGHQDYSRIIDIIRLYQYIDFTIRFSDYRKYSTAQQEKIYKGIRCNNKKLIDIIAYCIMPTHLHLVVKQITDDGISKYISKVLNSYTRYFNCIHKRKGPLWEGRFRNILVESDEQLLHLTRYIHLNPTSSKLVTKPEQWSFSSYHEYHTRKKSIYNITKYRDLIEMSSSDYKKFVNNRIAYQKELSKIKSLLIGNYSG